MSASDMLWRENNMSGGSFELLMDEVLNQKRIMDELLAENHSLRRQLADLRGGRGTFLEDMLVDEFATEVTSPMAVWKGAKKTRKLTGIDEEEKATLRKELIGSFLLE